MAAEIATGVPKPRRAFDERAEAESNQQHLDAPVVSQSRNRVFDRLESAGDDGDFIEKNRAEHDPADRKQPKRRAIGCRRKRQRHRHPVDRQRHQQ
jgi:hypothetical protein